MAMLIKNGTIHTMAGKTYPKGDILIQNGKLIQIASVIKEEGWKESCQVLDAAGLQIYPGFIDAHSHIGITEEKMGLEGNDCNEVTNPVTPCLRAIDAINPMDSAFHNAIAAGITSVMAGPGSSNAIGGQFAFLKTDGRCIDSMVVLAPAALKVAFGENPKMGYGGQNMMPSSRMSIASLIREELFRAQRYYQEKQASDRSSFLPDYTLECYLPLFSGAIPLKAHVHRTDDILTAIRIAREFGLGLTLDHCTEGHLIVDEILKSGFPAIVGPSLAARSKAEVCHSDFKTAGILHHAGVLVALTTDHPVSRLQYLPLCAGLAAKEGMGEEGALQAITINAAKICRVDHRVGSLEPGKDADLVLLDGSPLEIASNVIYTFIDGRLVYRKTSQ